MRLADVIGRDIPSLSTPTVTVFPGADLNDANVFGSPAKLVDLSTFGDGISHSLSDLNLLRPLHGDKQVGTGGENPGPQSPPGGRTTPRSLTDGFKFTAPKPSSATGDNPTGRTSAKVGAKISDSLQRAAENIDKSVPQATDSVGKGGRAPGSGGTERLRGRDRLGDGKPRGSSGRQPSDRVGRVELGQPEFHGRAPSERAGLAARDRRGVRAVRD